jgi:hypothetical protein
MVNKKNKSAVTVKVQAAAPKNAAPKPRRRGRRAARRSNVNRRMARFNMSGVSAAGRNFLKCAYASPDFSIDPGQGIPDGYEGKALMRKDVFTNTIAFGANLDTFILVLPTPGISYWTCTVAIGTFPLQTTVWTPVYNASFATLFGAQTNQAVDAPIDPVERDLDVVKFRYVSSTFEITPTSNFMQFAGSITVWKAAISLGEMVRTTGTGAAQTTTNQMALIGAEGVNLVSPDNKPFKFIDGAYSMAVNTEPTWEFKPVLSGITRIPGVGSGATTNTTFGQFQGDFVGVGDLQSLIFRVSTPTGAVNTAILKAWSCIEYQPNPTSALYQFSSRSPAKDEVAMKLYRDIALKVPVAVCVAENDGFWQDKVVPIIKSFLSAARVVGGVVPTVGAAMTGVDMITNAFGWL